MSFFRLSNYVMSGGLLTMLFLLLWGCGSGGQEGSDGREEVISGKMELVDGWARPGGQGMTSAAYLTIRNETGSQDTLVGVTSGTTGKAEVHESYKGENGMSSMRPVPDQVIAAGETIFFQPGGKHIMLINLKEDLASGDSVDVRLKFRQAGTQAVQLPVKNQNK